MTVRQLIEFKIDCKDIIKTSNIKCECDKVIGSFFFFFVLFFSIYSLISFVSLGIKVQSNAVRQQKHQNHHQAHVQPQNINLI